MDGIAVDIVWKFSFCHFYLTVWNGRVKNMHRTEVYRTFCDFLLKYSVEQHLVCINQKTVLNKLINVPSRIRWTRSASSASPGNSARWCSWACTCGKHQTLGSPSRSAGPARPAADVVLTRYFLPRGVRLRRPGRGSQMSSGENEPLFVQTESS